METMGAEMCIRDRAPGGLTVAELVAYGRYPHQKGFGRLRKEDYEAIDRALEMTHMEEFAERDIDALSGGQRQRAWIAKMCIRDRSKAEGGRCQGVDHQSQNPSCG